MEAVAGEVLILFRLRQPRNGAVTVRLQGHSMRALKGLEIRRGGMQTGTGLSASATGPCEKERKREMTMSRGERW